MKKAPTDRTVDTAHRPGRIEKLAKQKLRTHSSLKQSRQSKRLTKHRLIALAESLVAQEIDFIADKRYQRKNADRKFNTDDVYHYISEMKLEIRSTDSMGIQEMAAEVGQTPLLSPEYEELFFSQMNYLKFRFNQLRSKIDPDEPDRELVIQTEKVLDRAQLIRDLLIRSNLRLVISVTRKFVTPQMPFDELFSDGVVALMQAVEKFDVARGYRFSTYAYYSVSRSMYRYTKRLKKKIFTVESLDLNTDSDKPAETLMPETSWSGVSEQLDTMISRLDEREQWIVRQRYSFDGTGKTPTYKHLAEQLGVCNERVRQLEKRAIAKMRNMQETRILDDLVESASR